MEGGGGQKGDGDCPPYGPPARRGDGRSVLRPYGLACTYSSQVMVVGGDWGVAVLDDGWRGDDGRGLLSE